MKKGLTLLMTLALVLAMAVGALAAEDWVTQMCIRDRDNAVPEPDKAYQKKEGRSGFFKPALPSFLMYAAE